MNTVLEAREASVRYLDAVEPPGGVARLRELILCLATAGRLAVTRGDQSHWQRLTLDQVGEWGSGGTPSKSHPEYYAGGTIPWLVIGDLNDGVVQSAATCISDLGLRNSSAKIVEPGTVLVAMYGSIGKLGVAGLRCATNQAIAFCRPNADVVTGDFLFLFLRSIRASLLQRGQGLAQQNISQKILRNIEISVPPLAEQARIVARVDELMQLCDALEAKGRLEAQQHARLLETLLGTLTDSTTPEELAANWQRVAEHFDLLLDRPEAVDVLEQTVLQLAVRGLLVPQDPSDEPAAMLLAQIRAHKAQLSSDGRVKRDKPLPAVDMQATPFALPRGWAWARFPELGEFGRGKSKHRPRNDPALFSPPIYPLVQTGEVARAKGTILEFHSKYSELGLAQSRLWPAGTLCITIAANIADAAVLGFDACFPDSVVGFVPASCLGGTNYFQAFLETAKTDLVKFAPATAQKNINLEILESLLVPLPPKSEIERIVSRVTELRRLCADLRQRLAASQATQSRLAGALVESVASA